MMKPVGHSWTQFIQLDTVYDVDMNIASQIHFPAVERGRCSQSSLRRRRRHQLHQGQRHRRVCLLGAARLQDDEGVLSVFILMTAIKPVKLAFK